MSDTRIQPWPRLLLLGVELLLQRNAKLFPQGLELLEVLLILALVLDLGLDTWNEESARWSLLTL